MVIRSVRVVAGMASLVGLLLLGLMFSGLMLSGCQGVSRAAETVIRPPARLDMDLLEGNEANLTVRSRGANAGVTPAANFETGLRRFYTARERRDITHATIRVPD